MRALVERLVRQNIQDDRSDRLRWAEEMSTWPISEQKTRSSIDLVQLEYPRINQLPRSISPRSLSKCRAVQNPANVGDTL